MRARGLALALLLGVAGGAGSCGDVRAGGDVPALQALTEDAVPLRVRSLSAGNLPSDVRVLLGDEGLRVEGEQVPRARIRARERSADPSLQSWVLPLRYRPRTAQPTGRVRWGELTIESSSSGRTEPPFWTARNGSALVTLAAEAVVPSGPAVVDYALERSSIEALDPEAHPGAQAAPEAFVRRTLTVGETTWSALVLPAPTAVDLDLRLPVGAQLQFQPLLAPLGSERGDGARLQVLVDGEAVAEHVLDPEQPSAPLALDLSAHAPGTARLSFETDPGPAGDVVGDYVVLGAPRVVAGGGAARPEEPGPRNVLFVLIDTLRADHLGLHGYPRPTSPHLEALAARGVHFTEAQAQSSWTRPAMASIFTGLYPSQHGVLRVDAKDALAPGFETLAERLAGTGRTTVGFVGNPQLGPAFGLHQGFGQLQVNGANAGAIVDDALDWLEAGRAAPFFLYLHVTDPHDPYVAHPAFDFLPDYEGRVIDVVDDLIVDRLDFARRVAGRLALEEHPVPWGDVSDEELAKMVALYDGEVAYTDRELGRLFAGLERLGLTDDTLVVVTSDHGEEFGEHGGYFHGYTLHREVLHVPLILAGPGVPAAGAVDAPAMHVDLVPTLLDLLGRELPRRSAADPPRGRSLVPLFHGEEAEPMGPLVQETGFRVPHKLARTFGGRKTIWQAVEDQLLHYAWPDDAGEAEDLLGDPEDAGVRGEALEARAFLELWKSEQAARFEVLRSGIGAAEVDDETRAQLRALGYVWDE